MGTRARARRELFPFLSLIQQVGYDILRLGIEGRATQFRGGFDSTLLLCPCFAGVLAGTSRDSSRHRLRNR